MKKIEIGYTVEKERWLEAADNLYELGQIMARNLQKMNRDGRGQEDADDLTADILLACTAIGYVAEFATDKCRFMPVRGNKIGKGKGGLTVRAVLMSMKPEWWEKILAGEKKMEIRKTAPKDRTGEPGPWPMLVLVYVSGTGVVMGKFYCYGYVRTNLLAGLQRLSCVPLADLVSYAGGPGGSVYAWIVKNPEKFDTPKPLAEFGMTRPPMSWQYIEIPETEG